MSGRLMVKEGIASILIKYQPYRLIGAVRVELFAY
jgi:hypothetical protein